MLVFTEIPSWTTSVELEERIIQMRFGDRYTQTLADGINAQALRFKLVFRQVRSSKAQAVMTFLQSVGAHTAFLWLPTIAPYNDRKRTWRAVLPVEHKFEQYDSENIEVDFEEDFNPATRVATPVPSPTSGTPSTISLTCATVGATIKYLWTASSDGAAPTELTGTPYMAPVARVAGQYLKAKAFKTDLLESLPSSNLYG